MTVLLVASAPRSARPPRYLTDRAVQTRLDTVFPWGTFLINVTGSALLGFLAALPAHAADGNSHRDRAVRGVHHLLHL